MMSLKTRFQATIEGAGNRVFLLSGLEDDRRQTLAIKIRELGGVYLESEAFRPHCTHIVCGKITRSEKFLGGCATGRWVLNPDYITVSSENGVWEAEEKYEWANYASPDNRQMVESARRWRFHAEVYQTLAFSDWKTAVVVPGNKKASIYKRLLISGGAEVYNLKLPVKNPGKVMNLLTFVFVSERLAMDVCDLMEYGILCLKPEYIGDYLVKDPAPDPLDYLVKPKVSPLTNISMNDVDNSILSGSQGDVICSQEVMCSQGDVSSSQETIPYTCDNIPSSAYSTPASSPAKEIIKSNQSLSKDPLISPLVTGGRAVNVTRSRRSMTQTNSSQEGSTCRNNTESLPSNSETGLLHDDSSDRQSCSLSLDRNSGMYPLWNHARKESNIIHKVLTNSFQCRSWKPAVFTGRPFISMVSQKRKHEQDSENGGPSKKLKSQNTRNLGKRMPLLFSTLLTNMINQCFDDEGDTDHFLYSGLDMILSSLSQNQFPQSSTLHIIMSSILQKEKSAMLVQKAYNVLMRVLQSHPPTQSLVKGVYMDSFLPQQANVDNQLEREQQWDFIKKCMEQAVVEDIPSKGHLLLLQYIVAVLDNNFQYHMASIVDGESSIQKLRSCMISQILWPELTQPILNNKCRQLMSLFWDSLCCSTNQGDRVILVKCITSLVSMVTSICHITEMSPHLSSSEGMFRTLERTDAFIQEISRTINKCEMSPSQLQLVLLYVQSPVICLHVCCTLLASMDDYLILGEIAVSDITLADIVAKYLYLLPKVNRDSLESEIKSPHSKIRRGCTEIKSAGAEAVSGRRQISLKTEPTKHVLKELNGKPDTVHKGPNVNKRNFRGETALHIACIRNNVNKVKELLKIPGVDVNIKDNAGWTPLHEACNHGHVECVRELLQFVPAKTVKEYFGTDNIKAYKVDLLACTDELITPLHDAVLNNRTEVCRILLQHGGSSLLECRTIRGFTPVDLAQTDELHDLLSSYLFSDHELSQSCSQESTQSETLGEPSDFLYNHVLEEGSNRNYTSRQDTAKYIILVTAVIKSYLCVLEDQQVVPYTQDRAENLKSCQQTQISQKYHIIESKTRIGDEDTCRRLKRDWKILQKLRKYVVRFENHIERIAHPTDLPWLKQQLLPLYCYCERYTNNHKNL